MVDARLAEVDLALYLDVEVISHLWVYYDYHLFNVSNLTDVKTMIYTTAVNDDVYFNI